MTVSAEYWFLLPAAIAISTVAMASGIGGAVFFSPLFIIVLKLEPSIAIGTALITELFGFGSGLSAYWRRGLIDFRLGRQLLVFSIPGAIFGSLVSDAFPAAVLNTIFGTGIIFIGVQLYLSLRLEEVEALDSRLRRASGTPSFPSTSMPPSSCRFRTTTSRRSSVCRLSTPSARTRAS